jgi:hypothetical protein
LKKIQQGADLVIGSRYLPQSQVLERSFLRGLTSWGYYFLASHLLSLKVSDFPCGFKAINQRVKEEILPRVQNNQWFFDTELLVLTWQAGLRISEVPVVWKESSRASKVSLLKVIKNYLQEIFKLKARLKKNMRLCLVIPVYNEEKDLPICLKKLVSFCRQEIKDWEWSILIADNGSSDQTWLVAQELSKNYPEATAVKIETKGRGLALKKTWGIARQIRYFIWM